MAAERTSARAAPMIRTVPASERPARCPHCREPLQLRRLATHATVSEAVRWRCLVCKTAWWHYGPDSSSAPP